MEHATLSTRQPCPAYILAGGLSRRFGSDKARVCIDSQPLLLHLLAQLQQAGHSTYVVADREDRYRDLGVECLVDAVPGAGPLSGLVAAFENSQSMARKDSAAATSSRRNAINESQHSLTWLMLLSCDLVTWRAEWTRELMSGLELERSRGELQAIVFASQRLQPLPGLYRLGSLTIARQRLIDGQLSISDFLASCKMASMTTHISPQQFSFNTRAELDETLRFMHME